MSNAKTLECDVLIIGSGAGGGPLALELSRAGFEVIVLEKGPRHPREAYGRDEVEVTRRSFFAPKIDQDPHTVVTRGSPESRLTQLGWIASCVGGGTAHMGAYLYRFHPDDFRMASRFGSPADPSGVPLELVDWPFGYDELEPFYTKAEHEVGVSGLGGVNPFEGPRSGPYPMPPLDAHPVAELLEDAMRARGGHPFPTPRAVTSRPYMGRPPCVYCEACAGYGCPVGARGSSQEALLPRAEATGRCRVLADRMVRKISVDDRGRATGCEFFDPEGELRAVRAGVVCICCSAVESARLLLLSRSSRFPDGLANGSSRVGRHLQFHAVSMGEGWIAKDRMATDRMATDRMATDRMAREIANSQHPFLGRSMMDHYFLPDGVSELPKGGLLRFFIQPPSPVATAERFAFGQTPMLWGRGLQEALGNHFQDGLSLGFEVFHDFLPNAETYVDLDPKVRDRWGLPVARIHLHVPEHHRRCGQWVMDRAFELLTDLGAERLVRHSVGGTSAYLVHGTCRAGDDPSTSVLDRFCRTHEVENLYVVDGSFMPTSGGASPTLTILANSFRVAEHLAKKLR